MRRAAAINDGQEKVDSWESVLQVSVGVSCKLLNPEDSE